MWQDVWQDAAAGLIALGALLYLARALLRGGGCGEADGCGTCAKSALPQESPLIPLEQIVKHTEPPDDAANRALETAPRPSLSFPRPSPSFPRKRES